MTKEQIQALIDAKIAGQGSAVDVGGALPEILSGILEIASSGEKKATEIVVLETGYEEESTTKILAALQIDGKTPTFEELLNVIKNNNFYFTISPPVTSENNDKFYPSYIKTGIDGKSLTVYAGGEIMPDYQNSILLTLEDGVVGTFMHIQM